jgi:hypothetical protein
VWNEVALRSPDSDFVKAFYEIAVEPSTGTSAIYAQSENVINRHPE